MAARPWLLVFVLWAAYVSAVASFSTLTMGDPGFRASPYAPKFLHGIAPSIDGIPALARWDAVWYFEIAQNGYDSPTLGVSARGMLPLYPLLMRGLSEITGLDLWTAGTWVSRLALLAAMLATLFYVRSIPQYAPEHELHSTLLLLAHPAAFIFLAIYSEALFLALAAGTIVFWRKQRYLLAAILAFLAGLTRLQALVLAMAVGVDLLWTWKKSGRPPWRAFVTPVAGIAGFVSYMAYCAVAHGDFFAYFVAKRGFAGVTTTPWDVFANASERMSAVFQLPTAYNADGLLQYLFAIGLVVAAVVFLKRRQPLEAAFVAGLVAMSVASGSLWGLVRFSLAAFPMFALGARGGRPWIGAAIAICFVLQCLFLGAFIRFDYPAP